MTNTGYVKRDSIENYFPLPNQIFDLKLHHKAIVIYAYLLRIEDRNTYQCVVSYTTIAEVLDLSVNTVAKYVSQLRERGLIRTERTKIRTKNGRKQNGCLRYFILSIREVQKLYFDQKMSALERSVEQQKVQKKASEKGVELQLPTGT
ncbi:MAG: helix-turn-helix domain-containing protein [Oscillospiraceae bacterium]|nr:helix-turn-helix domain-containing protein [Oscillospiraceae bacterium]